MRAWRMVAAGVGCLLLAGAMGAQDFKVSDGKAKLQLCSGLPCVEVMVDKEKLLMAIDTGNPHSVVDVALARNEGLDTTPYVGSDGKPRPGVSLSEVPSVKAGTVTFTSLPVLVAPLLKPKAADQMPEVDGTLGYEAFKGKLLRLDFKKNTLEVTSSGGCSGGTMKLITFGKSGPLTVTTTGFSVNGKPVVAQVDTLFAGSMLVFPDAVEKLGLTDLTKTKAREHFPYTFGGVDMIKASATEDFSGKPLGDQTVYFATPEVHLPDALFDAKIGFKLLAGHTVTFDFAGSCFGIL